MGFYIAAAALGLVALLFVVWPALRSKSQPEAVESRSSTVVSLYEEHLQDLTKQLEEQAIDSAQFEQLKTELDRALLEDTSGDSIQSADRPLGKMSLVALLSVGLMVPIAGFLFYSDRGSLADVEIVELREQLFAEQQAAFEAGQPYQGQTLEALYAALQQRVTDKPSNLQNQYLLARISVEKGEVRRAIEAYTAILREEPEAADILAELAQLIFLANGNQVIPEIDDLVRRALSINPDEPTALGLAGISAFQKQAFGEAIGYWQRALTHMAPQSQSWQSLQAGIVAAQQQMGVSANTDVAQGVAGITGEQQLGVSPEASSTSITVSVSLGDGVVIDPNDTVFVYARAWRGPKMPLAITRFNARELPKFVTLDETMAMVPGMSITSFEELELVARVSKSGQPAAQSGDWQAAFGPLTLVSQKEPLSLTISEQLP